MRGGDISLLYVDENKTTCEKLSPILNHFFKKLDIAHSCDEALKLYEKRRHDIVVTDVIFKQGSGHTFFEKLKSFDPFQKIIIVSSFVERKRILHLINSVVYGYLMKPINVSELLHQLEKISELVYEKKLMLFYIDSLEKNAMHHAPHTVQKEESSFLVFDNNERDEAIHRMHYPDNNKISAQDFFEQGLMDEDTINDLRFCSKELEAIFLYTTLTHEYLAETADFINAFSKDLELSGEFRDIAYALRGLCVALRELIVEHDFSQATSKVIKTILDSIIEDLVSWTQHVLIVRDAVDIHYLDASLLANSAQFGLSIKNLSSNAVCDEEELELF